MLVAVNILFLGTYKEEYGADIANNIVVFNLYKCKYIFAHNGIEGICLIKQKEDVKVNLCNSLRLRRCLFMGKHFNEQELYNYNSAIKILRK